MIYYDDIKPLLADDTCNLALVIIVRQYMRITVASTVTITAELDLQKINASYLPKGFTL